MPLELNATDQFNSCLRVAQESQAAGKETAIARRGNIYNPIYEQQEQVPAFEFVKKD